MVPAHGSWRFGQSVVIKKLWQQPFFHWIQPNYTMTYIFHLLWLVTIIIWKQGRITTCWAERTSSSRFSPTVRLSSSLSCSCWSTNAGSWRALQQHRYAHDVHAGKTEKGAANGKNLWMSADEHQEKRLFILSEHTLDIQMYVSRQCKELCCFFSHCFLCMQILHSYIGQNSRTISWIKAVCTQHCSQWTSKRKTVKSAAGTHVRLQKQQKLKNIQ